MTAIKRTLSVAVILALALTIGFSSTSCSEKRTRIYVTAPDTVVVEKPCKPKCEHKDKDCRKDPK